MTKAQALQILEQALNNATLKGTFGLKDVAMVLQALEVVKTQ